MLLSRDLTVDLVSGLPWVIRAAKVGVILGLAWLLTRMARRLLGGLHGYASRSVRSHGDALSADLEKRTATIVAVVSKLVSTLIWMVAVVMALTELTFNIEPLLAGLGVAGLALGLGAQTLIKDWLGGIFLLLEDQIRIGDSVSVNNVGGVVEEINLRTTVLRSENGAVHMIPNGSIGTLSNLSREYCYYVFETTIAHRADAEKALQLVTRVGEQVAGEEPYAPFVLSGIEVMGVDRLGERGSTIRARIKTIPSKQHLVGREINLRVKRSFDAEGVEFPPPA